MKSSDINSFLTAGISPLTFKNIIAADVNIYGQLLTKKGSTISLNFTDDETISLDKNKFLRLLNHTIDGHLNNIDLAYICDCLTLAEEIKCDDDEIINAIYELADPEINGGFSSTNQLNQIIFKLHGQ